MNKGTNKNDKSGYDMKNISRRELLVNAGKIGLFSFVALKTGLVTQILSSGNALADDEKKENFNDNLNDNLNGVSNDILEKHSDHMNEHEKRTIKQQILNATASGVFGGIVLPKFLKEEVNDAFRIGMTMIVPWYAFSDKHSKEAWNHEMVSAAEGVGMMAGILNIAEMFNLDIKGPTEEYLTTKYQKNIKQILQKDDMKEFLDELNIKIDYGEHKETCMKNGKVEISVKKFMEILPLGVKGVNLFIDEIIHDLPSLEMQEEAENIMTPSDHKIGELEDKVKAHSLDIKQHEAEMILGRIQYLTTFIFLTQIPLFGVGQAAIAKEEIKSITLSIRNLFLSNGHTETDANEYAYQIEGKMVAYLFNRFAFSSDIGPLTASLQKGGTEGVLKLIDSMLVVSAANIYPFMNDIKSVLCKGDGISYISNMVTPESVIREGKSISTQIGKYATNYLNTIFTINNKYNNNQMITNWKGMVSGLGKMDSIDIENKEQEIINDLLNIERSINERGLKVDRFKIAGKSLNRFQFIEYLSMVSDAKLFNKQDSLKFKKTLNSIFNSPHYNFSKVYEAIEMLLHTTKKGDKKVKSVEKFVRKYLKKDGIGRNKKLADYKKADLSPHFTGVLKDIKLAQEANNMGSQDFMDLDVSIKDYPIILGGAKGVAILLAKNIKFLMFLKEMKEKDLYLKFKEKFVKNITNTDNRNVERVENANKLLGNVLSDKEREFYVGLSDNIRIERVRGKQNLSSESRDVLLKTLSKAGSTGTNQVNTLFEYGELMLGKNSWEVVQMVLLIQSPFVPAIVEMVTDIMKSDLCKGLGVNSKKFLIKYIAYVLSIFADNYVGEIVGVDLLVKNFGMKPVDAIAEVGKLAIVGGSNAITGNSPNAIIQTIQKIYTSSHDKRDIDEKDKSSINKILQIVAETLFDTYSLGATPSGSQLISGNVNPENLIAGIGGQLFQKRIIKAIFK